MSDLATIAQPSRKQPPARKLKVTGRLKAALDLMAWDGLADNEAAASANIHVLSLRMALRKPHVREYFRSQCVVLRERERARNIKRLAEIRDAADNMPAVNAIKALEQLGDEQVAATSRQSSPGIVIQVLGTATIAPQQSQAIEPGGERDDCTE